MALSAVVGLAGGYWTACSLLIHRSFHSNGWDLGLINQTLWNSAHGRLFEYSFRDISYAGDHWQPFLLVLVPLKWLHAGPEALLIVQAVALAVAVLPLYVAVRSMDCRTGAGALTGAYLFGLGVARAVSFDYHVETFAPIFAFAALSGLARKNDAFFATAALLVLTLKEDGMLLTLALCWIAWFAFERRQIATAVACAAVVYGLVATAVIIPHYRGSDLNPFAERYGYLGDSPVEVLWHMAARPDLVMAQLSRTEALEAGAIVLASAALLPLLAPRLLPPLAVVTLLPVLSKDPAQSALDLHYLLVPTTVALLIAAVVLRDRKSSSVSPYGRSGFAFPQVARRFFPLALVLIPGALLAFQSPLPPSFATELDRFEIDHHAAVARGFIRDIPEDAIVSAQSPFVPHISDRRHVYQFPRVLNAEIVLLDAAGSIPAQDLAAGFWDCVAALPRLGFDEMRRDDGISLWRKRRPAESASGAPEVCSGRHPGPAWTEGGPYTLRARDLTRSSWPPSGANHAPVWAKEQAPASAR